MATGKASPRNLMDETLAACEGLRLHGVLFMSQRS